MSPFRETVRQLLDLLKRAGPPRNGADSGELVGVIGALADTSNVRVVPDLAPFMFHGDLLVARTAAQAVERLLSMAGAELFVWLDRNARLSDPRPVYGGQWRHIRPGEVQRLSSRTGCFNTTCGLLTLHWNGHVREEAIRLLADADPLSAAPFLLLRLNDWVEEVRSLAASVVDEWLRQGLLTPLALCMPLVARLRGPVRGRNEELVAEIRRRLLSEEPPGALLAACRSPDRGVRRQAFDLAFDREDRTPESLVDEGLVDSDPVVRLRTVRRALPAMERLGAVERLQRAMEDRFMPVRREALLALAEISLERTVPALWRAVLDPHPAIRYSARWLLSRRGEEQFASRYREVLAQPASRKLLATALSGLGEVGASSDLPAVLPFLSHPSVRVRASAVGATAKLDEGRDPSILLQSLLDDSPKVSREAAQALRGKALFLGTDKIWECFQAARTPNARQNVLHLLAKLPVVDRLTRLLRVAASPDDPLATEALQLATATLLRPNLGYVRVSKGEADEILNELASLEGRLEQSIQQQVKLLVRACWGAS